MKIPELILQEFEENNAPLEKRFRELNDKENLTGPELKEFTWSDLAGDLKRNRDTILNLKEKPYTTSAKIKMHDDEQQRDLLVEIKLGLEEALTEERKAFYPSLFNKDFSGHELQRQHAEELNKKLVQDGVNGINKIFDTLEESIQIGRTDFSSILIERIDKYFADNRIPSGQPLERFTQIKNDFLSIEKRLETKSRLEDLRTAKKIIDEYNFKFSHS